MKNQALEDNLPPIPDKLYFSIGEVAKLCDAKPHVLRYWEQEFKELNPNKRRGNRRYYLRSDVLLIRKIKNLLYTQGYTIEGARQQLSSSATAESSSSQQNLSSLTAMLKDTIKELEQILETRD